MADNNQFLRIDLNGTSYLLPSAATVAIEQRDHLVLNTSENSPEAAWRVTGTARWPAYCLDQHMKPVRHSSWQRAIFLEGSPRPVGFIAADAQLMARTDVHIESFTPPGPSPVREGHLFNAAWVRGDQAILVINPLALASYLQTLGVAQ